MWTTEIRTYDYETSARIFHFLKCVGRKEGRARTRRTTSQFLCKRGIGGHLAWKRSQAGLASSHCTAGLSRFSDVHCIYSQVMLYLRWDTLQRVAHNLQSWGGSLERFIRDDVFATQYILTCITAGNELRKGSKARSFSAEVLSAGA